jgi:carboxylesterase
MSNNPNFSYAPGGAPFFFRGGPIGCLVMHGLTGMPQEVRPLGDYLAGQGHTVYGVRLAGHGTDPSDLIHLHWQDWLASAMDGLTVLGDQCEQVFVMGLSMGGLTAIHLAAARPEAVAGIVTMSTPVLPVADDWRLNLIDLIAIFQPYQPKAPRSPEEAERIPDHVSYEVWTTRAIKQFVEYQRLTDQALPHVTCPALLIHSKGDDFIKPENLNHIYDRLGSKEKERLWLEQSGHIVTEDLEREIVFERTAAFIRKYEARVTVQPYRQRTTDLPNLTDRSAQFG